MAKMRALHKVDENYPLTGPNQNTIVQPIDVSATRLFDCLVDGPAWSEWLGVDVRWTSPEPFGVGTTRTVTTAGQTIEEYFFTWRRSDGPDGSAMGFRFDRSTMPLQAFAELYQCLPTGPDSCVLRWSYAFEFAGGPLAPVLGTAFGVGFGLKARRSAAKLATLLETGKLG